MSDLVHAAVGFGIGVVLSPATVAVVKATATTSLRPRHVVAVSAATSAASAGVATWPWPVMIPGALLVLAGVPAATVDGIEHRIPDRLSIPLVVAEALAIGITAAVDGTPAQAAQALTAGIIWGGLFLLSFMLTGRPGPGDVKLAPSLGMALGWFGWTWLVPGIMLAYLVGIVVGLIGVVCGRLQLRGGRVPMGPPMLAATLISGTAAALIHLP